MRGIECRINITPTDSMPDSNTAIKIWYLLEKEVETLLFAGAAQKVRSKRSGAECIFAGYISHFDVYESFRIDPGSITYFFSDSAGTSPLSSAILSHWFTLAITCAKDKIDRILQQSGFQMKDPPAFEDIMEKEEYLFVNINNIYHGISRTDSASYRLLSDSGKETRYDLMAAHEKGEIDAIIQANRCGCHLCRYLEEKNKQAQTAEDEQALAAMRQWLQSNFGAEPKGLEVYFKEELVWFGSLQKCFLITYTMPGGFEGIGFTGPYTCSFKERSFQEFKKGYSREHKYMAVNYAAAQYILDYLQHRNPAAFTYSQSEYEKTMKVLLSHPPCPVYELTLTDHLKLADETIWFFKGTGALEEGTFLAGKKLERAEVEHCLAHDAPECSEPGGRKKQDFIIQVRWHFDNSVDITAGYNKDDITYKLPVHNSLRKFGPYSGNGCYPVRQKTLDDPVWQKYRAL